MPLSGHPEQEPTRAKEGGPNHNGEKMAQSMVVDTEEHMVVSRVWTLDEFSL